VRARVRDMVRLRLTFHHARRSAAGSARASATWSGEMWGDMGEIWGRYRGEQAARAPRPPGVRARVRVRGRGRGVVRGSNPNHAPRPPGGRRAAGPGPLTLITLTLTLTLPSLTLAWWAAGGARPCFR